MRFISRLTVALLLVGSIGCGRSNPPPTPQPSVTETGAEAASEQTQADEAAEASAAPDTAGAASTTSEDASETGSTAAEPPPGHIERLLVFTPGGPLVVEIAITIDGRRGPAVTDELIDELLAAADTDGDGSPTWEEAIANPRFAFGQFAAGSMSGEADRKQLYDRDEDGVVDRPEVWRYLSHGDEAGLAFRLSYGGEAASYDSAAGDLNAFIDADHDGRVSTEEIAAAFAEIKRADADDDDLLQRAELVGPMDVMQPGMAPRREGPQGPPPVMSLGESPDWVVLDYELRERYGRPRQLTRESFPLTPSLFDVLDIDDSGAIESFEVEHLNDVPPHVRLAANFGTVDASVKPLAVMELAEDLGAVESVVTTSDRSLAIVLPTGAVACTLRDMASLADSLEQMQEQFAAADADNNGYLEVEELPDDQRPRFASYDADDDGKIQASEMIAARRREQAPLVNRIRAHVSEARGSLFTALDASRDGRLSLREMRDAATRLSSLDGDRDGWLTNDELPARLELTLTRGDAGDMTSGPDTNAYEAAPSAGPLWFARMDSNGDRDVSPREFLGPREAFARLDANSDGLIAEDEAGQGAAETEGDD